jgi:aminoglycoside phosphotransferase (APT) family kinase protein
LLLEWVDGPVLDSLEPIPPDVLVHAGELLGALHELDFDPAVPDPTVDLGERLSKLGRDVAVLTDTEALEPELGRLLLGAATARAPSAATTGIIHKDFCPSNIVLRGDTPVPIDNANLGIGPHDLDLARTWYRWTMSPEERRQFARGYRDHRSLDGFLEHFLFWATSVLVGSASTRIRARSDQARVPLARLRMLLDLLQGNARTDPVAFGWPEGAPPPSAG